MGNAVSEAREAQNEETQKLQNMIAILENKRREFVERVELTRGQGEAAKIEIQGGRTASRISQLRVADNDGVDPQIKNAIGDFLTAAQGGDKAKSAAVAGATSLLSAGLDALFGSSSGAGMEKLGFVVLYINFAFVRVDYYVYSYNSSGSKWGAKAFESGSCYVADLAILEPNNDVHPYEMDYLIGQSLSIPDSSTDSDAEYEAILEIKLQLTQSLILSRLLSQENLTIDNYDKVVEKVVESETKLKTAFQQLSDWEKTP